MIRRRIPASCDRESEWWTRREAELSVELPPLQVDHLAAPFLPSLHAPSKPVPCALSSHHFRCWSHTAANRPAVQWACCAPGRRIHLVIASTPTTSIRRSSRSSPCPTMSQGWHLL